MSKINVLPPCIKRLSFKAFVVNHIKGKSTLFNTSRFVANGIIANAERNHHSPTSYLQEQVTEYNNKIITKCRFLGPLWSAVKCDLNRLEEFYKLAGEIVQESVKQDVFDEIEKEAETFLEYFIVVVLLTDYIEKNKDTMPQQRCEKQAMLSVGKITDKVERIKQSLDKVLLVKAKKKYPDLLEKVARYSVEQCSNGKEFFGLAACLYEYKSELFGVNAPKTLKQWARSLQAICECSFSIEHYKRSKVDKEIEQARREFWFLRKT